MANFAGYLTDKDGNKIALNSSYIKNGTRMLDEILEMKDLTDVDLNTFIGKNMFGYGNNLINSADSYTAKYSWVINLTHPSMPASYNRQIVLTLANTDTHIYTRTMYDGVWSSWRQL